MAERQESPHNRAVMKPPRYLNSVELNPLPWGHPHKTRRQELNAYEQARNIGAAERDPALEERLLKRRQRQMQNHERRMQADQQPPAS